MEHVNFKRAFQALLLENNASYTRRVHTPAEALQLSLEDVMKALDLYPGDERMDGLIRVVLPLIDEEGNQRMIDPVKHRDRLIALQTAKSGLEALLHQERVSL